MASKLDILIAAKNNASPALKQVAGDVSGLDKAAGTLSKGLGGLALAGGIAGIAALGGAAVSAAMDMSRLAAQATDVEASFKGLASSAGESSAAMMGALKESSRGAISDFDLMLSANRAMLLGVTDNTNDMVALMDIARARSQAMGITTTQAFGDIVTGIGRNSNLILDNLGIVVDLASANEIYAASIGKTVSQLTEQEKKQALLNAVIRDSAEIVAANVAAGDDAASNFERMDAAAANAKIALAELFSPAMIYLATRVSEAATAVTSDIQTLGEVAEEVSLTSQTRDLENMIMGIEHLQEAMSSLDPKSELYQQLSETLKRNQGEVILLRTHLQSLGVVMDGTPVASLQSRLEAAAESYKALSSEASISENVIARLSMGMALGAQSADQLAAATYAAARGIAEAGLMAALAQEQFTAARAQSQGIADSISGAAAASGALFAGEQGGDAGLSRQKAVTKELTTQRKLWEDQNYTTKEIDEVLMPGYIKQLNEADRAMFSTAASTKTMSEEARAAEQAFNSLKGTVEGVLSGALNTGVASADSILESMGLREDAINEDARRLADVAVNGWASPWADYFRTTFPDMYNAMFFSGDIKGMAAQQLKDFEDGMNPELIDRGRAKERIKRMITGDASMAELAQEIAGELAAEMGVPLQEALGAAQGALGVGGASGTAGGEAAQTFSDGASIGLDGSNAGGTFIDRYAGQMRGSFGILRTAGADAAKAWGDSFYGYASNHLSPALIQLLATLITPSVQGMIAQQGTLTGAAP